MGLALSLPFTASSRADSVHRSHPPLRWTRPSRDRGCGAPSEPRCRRAAGTGSPLCAPQLAGERAFGTGQAPPLCPVSPTFPGGGGAQPAPPRHSTTGPAPLGWVSRSPDSPACVAGVSPYTGLCRHCSGPVFGPHAAASPAPSPVLHAVKRHFGPRDPTRRRRVEEPHTRAWEGGGLPCPFFLRPDGRFSVADAT